MKTGSGLIMPRRALLGTAVAGLVLSRAGLPLAGNSKIPPDIELRVSREGKEIGRHHVRFAATETGFEAHTTVDLEIKAAIITFFHYHQESIDHWVGGKLVKSVGSCDDDGDKTEFEAWAEGDQLVFEGRAGRGALPLGTMTDLSFWNPDILATTNVIDAQTADIDPMSVDDLGKEIIDIAGAKTEANRYYAASGDVRHGDIWYDESGRWVRADFHTRGELLEFELIS